MLVFRVGQGLHRCLQQSARAFRSRSAHWTPPTARATRRASATGIARGREVRGHFGNYGPKVEVGESSGHESGACMSGASIPPLRSHDQPRSSRRSVDLMRQVLLALEDQRRDLQQVSLGLASLETQVARLRHSLGDIGRGGRLNPRSSS